MRIVLHEHVGPHQIRILSQELGWSFEDDHELDGLSEALYVDDDARTSILFVIDRVIGLNSLVLGGQGADATAAQVRSRGNIAGSYTREQALTRDEDPATPLNERIHSTMVFALSLTEHGAADHAAFRRMFQDPQEEVREAAIVAAGYVGWPELQPDLESVGRTDPSPSIRRKAEVMLRAFENEQGPQQS